MNQINDSDFKYVWFDFHAECAKMKWENLSKLVQQVKEQLVDYNYFTATLLRGFDEIDKMANEATYIQKEQKGVIRTNCMDCLDRTNVV